MKAEHDKYVLKKREYIARKKALDDEAKFRELKSKFFGISFTTSHFESEYRTTTIREIFLI